MITYWPTMERCAAIAKQELMYVGPFGFAAALCGTIYIKRDKPNDSHSTMNQAAEKVKRKRVLSLSLCPCVLTFHLRVCYALTFTAETLDLPGRHKR